MSPLVSNILFTELDRELEKRGHRFRHFVDDCNTFVKSRKAGMRVKQGITRFLADRLKLVVNEAKRAVDRPWSRKFLGYSVTVHQSSKRKVAATSLKRLMVKVRELGRQE